MYHKVFPDACCSLMMLPCEGGRDYQIKGCAGQGGFAQVFKAYVNSDPDDVVALKVRSFFKNHADLVALFMLAELPV